MITEKQLQERKNYLGSSDIAAILGVSPYANAYDIFLQKTGRVPIDNKGNQATHAGTFLEVGVLDWAENQLGKLKRYNDEKLKDNIEISVPGFPIVDHPDSIVIETNRPVEGKTAGLFGPLTENYGEGIDELPDRVIIQCHVHMLATDSDLCHVPCFIGGRGFVMYEVKRDMIILNAIMDASIDFWDNYVEKDSPPPNVIPSGEFVKRIKREPEKSVDIDKVLVDNWKNAKEMLKRAESIKNESQNELLAALGNAEAGIYPGGMVTFYEQSQKRTDSTRLKKEKPDIYNEYLKVSRFRVLRNKEVKSVDKFDISHLE